MATGKENKLGVNPMTVKKLKVLFRILSHPVKVKILEKIEAADQNTGICVLHIYTDKKIDLGQSHASIILSELRREKMVETRREGKNIFYTINKKTLDGAVQLCNQAIEMKLFDK